MVSNTRQTKNKRANRLKKMGKKRKNLLNKKGTTPTKENLFAVVKK